FDAAISDGETPIDTLRSSLAGIEGDPSVERVGWVGLVNLTIEGGVFEAYAFDPDASGVHPTMRSGRPPLANDEIALGADLMGGRRGLSIGDSVTVAGASGSRRLRIVGSATYPEVGNNADLGSTASLTLPAARAIGAQEAGSVALVRLAPGATTAALDRYRSSGEVVAPFEPPRVHNLRQIGALPWLLAAFVALVGALAMAHGLWVSIRTRRRELSVLRAVGLRPRDLRAMHLAQAECVAAIGIGLGLLAGALVATRAWSIVAAGTAVVDRVVVPAAWLALTALAALTVAGAVGLVAARSSGRTSPAVGLREE
ncbi:MAG: ABC transporter permease, partial [Microthrixaceae bacterium]